jgi:hypothetical protein
MQRGFHREWKAKDVTSLESFLSLAPQNGDLRITFIQVRFWDHMPIVAKVIRKAQQSQRHLQSMYFYMQSAMQYFYCYPMKATYCTRPDMKKYTLKQLEARYKADLSQMIRVMKFDCKKPSTRCFVSNVDVFNPEKHYIRKVANFNRIIGRIVAKYPMLQLVNNHALSSAKQDEIVSGHPSHFLNTWAYQRLFSVLCLKQKQKRSSVVAGCKDRLQMSKNCHKVEWLPGTLKPRWESMIQRRCVFSTEAAEYKS